MCQMGTARYIHISLQLIHILAQEFKKWNVQIMFKKEHLVSFINLESGTLEGRGQKKGPKIVGKGPKIVGKGQK